MPGSNYDASTGSWRYPTTTNATPKRSTGSAGSTGSTGLSGMMYDRVYGSSGSVGSTGSTGSAGSAGSTERGSLPVPSDDELDNWRRQRGYGDDETPSEPPTQPSDPYGDEREAEYRRQQQQAMYDNGIYSPEYTNPTEPNTPPSSGGSYTVKNGDTLWSIARTHLGPNASNTDIANYVSQLASKNGISNPNLIRPGQVINF